MGQSNSDDKLYFLYSADGKLIGFNRNGLNYYYAYNVQGDVIALYNCYSQLNSRYVYDSWGRVREVLDANGDEITDTTHVAHVNPIRYRGYYYDNETGLYYVASRYYDPVTGRFINADSQLITSEITGMNLFAYCGNNPVNNCDPSGHLFVGAAIGGIVGGLFGGLGALISGQSVKAGAFTGALTGAAIGLIFDNIATCSVTTIVGASVLCVGVSVAGNLLNQYLNYEIETSNNNGSSSAALNTDNNANVTGGNMQSEYANFAEYIEIFFE